MRARRCRSLPCGRVFTGLCLGYAGTGTFRVGQTVHRVGPGALFVARPGQVHEIDSTST
ncbi:MAG: AraC family ligand binding domain-containing protein, partial [Nocardioides sp.]